MKKIKTGVFTVLFVLMVLMGTSQAGDTAGKITGILSFGMNNVYFIFINGTYSNPLMCNTQRRYAIDTTSQGGRNVLSIALSAFLSGKNVNIVGNGNCSVWGDSETLQYIHIYD